MPRCQAGIRICRACVQDHDDHGGPDIVSYHNHASEDSEGEWASVSARTPQLRRVEQTTIARPLICAAKNAEGGRMLCQRCRGLLVRVTFDDLSEEICRMSPATRCVNCGCIEDEIVLANRLRPTTSNRSEPRGTVKKSGLMLTKAYARAS